MGPWSHLWLAVFGPSLMRASVVGVCLCVVLLANGGEAVELRVLAAGATEATLRSVVGTFEQESGHTIRLAYGAVGLLRDQIYAGARPDLAIVTPAILEQLQAKGLVVPATAVALGRVGGGIAVRAGPRIPR